MARGFTCGMQCTIDLLWSSSLQSGFQHPMSPWSFIFMESLVVQGVCVLGGGGRGAMGVYLPLEQWWNCPDFWFSNVGRYVTVMFINILDTDLLNLLIFCCIYETLGHLGHCFAVCGSSMHTWRQNYKFWKISLFLDKYYRNQLTIGKINQKD